MFNYMVWTREIRHILIQLLKYMWFYNVYIIIIYHDFLPTPRRGSDVKSDKTHTQSSSLKVYVYILIVKSVHDLWIFRFIRKLPQVIHF